MLKHSEAPWTVSGQSEGGRYIKVSDATGRTVARVPFTPEKEAGAGHANDYLNAQLISTAPDLLKALERMNKMHNMMMEKINHGASFYDADTLREMNKAPIEARAEISKARGES